MQLTHLQELHGIDNTEVRYFRIILWLKEKLWKIVNYIVVFQFHSEIICDKAPIEGIYGYSNALLFKTNILLPNNIIFKNHLVYGTKLGSIDMLIGMDIISKCDSTILNAENNIEFSFKIPIVENNEYELYDNSDQEN